MRNTKLKQVPIQTHTLAHNMHVCKVKDKLKIE